MQSKPGKVDVRKGQLVFSYWQLPTPAAPGLYRVDLLVSDKLIWRDFVRITP